MTDRERFLAVLNGKPYDRMIAVQFGYWKELLCEWADKKLIPRSLTEAYDGNEADRELDKIIGWDFTLEDKPNVYENELYPFFEWRYVERMDDGYIKIQNLYGAYEVFKDGYDGIPGEYDYILKDRESFDKEYLPRLRFDEKRIHADVIEKLVAQPNPQKPRGIFAGSLLGVIRRMFSLTGLGMMMYDHPDVVTDAIDALADLQYRLLENVLARGVKFDYALYFEDMCYNNGCLVDPAFFKKTCFAHYVKRNALLKKYGVNEIALDCDGRIFNVAPMWYESGVNIMFPLEVGTWGDQFAALKSKMPGIKGVGGVDKFVFSKTREDVDREIDRIKRLVGLKCYIPCPDHRLPPSTDFNLLKYYVEKIKEIKGEEL